MDEFIIGVIIFSAVVLLISTGFVKWFDTLERKRALLGGGASRDRDRSSSKGLSKNMDKILFLIYLFIGIAFVTNFYIKFI